MKGTDPNDRQCFGHVVGPALDPNCLQMLQADVKSYQKRFKSSHITNQINYRLRQQSHQYVKDYQHFKLREVKCQKCFKNKSGVFASQVTEADNGIHCHIYI